MDEPVLASHGDRVGGIPDPPIDWDPARLLDDLADALRVVMPAALEIVLTDHARGIGVARDGRLVQMPPALRAHFGTVAAAQPREQLGRSICGRVERTLGVVQDAVSHALGQAWPDGGPSGARAVVTAPRTVQAGWAATTPSGHATWRLALPPLVVHPDA